MMELLASKSDNPSECVRIWIKEIESCGFGSFSYETEGLNCYYDPQSAGINVQSPQSESTPRRLTLIELLI